MSTRVITYGTFDLFHEGHVRLLERAKALGDHLIVAVTTDNYDSTRGKLNVSQSLMERINNVQKSGLADEVIIEEYEGQKINDIQQHGVDIFAIGSDWLGKFDYLRDYCEVVYLDRTKGVSSTMLRNESAGILRLGQSEAELRVVTVLAPPSCTRAPVRTPSSACRTESAPSPTTKRAPGWAAKHR
jgi:choline-phosphate cytidylyltransferase